MKSLLQSPAFLLGVLLVGAVFGVSLTACIHFRREKVRFVLWGLTAVIGILLLATLFFAVTGLPFPSVAPVPETAPAETTVPPVTGELWYADCNEYITLRTAPDVTAPEITRIPVREEMTVLSWEGIFARVDYQGQQGYVLGSYVQPVHGPKAIDLSWNGGAKRALPYSREGFQIFLPVTGWTETGDAAWQSDSCPEASVTLLVTTGKTPEEVRALRKTLYPGFTLLEDKRGGLNGTDDARTINLEIDFYSLPRGILTVAIQYPIDQLETIGYELHAIADSVVLK